VKGYCLHKDDSKHFEISHPKKGVFKVAKKGLDKKTLSKIKSLPKGMYDGGSVGEEEDTQTASSTSIGGDVSYSDYSTAEKPEAEVENSEISLALNPFENYQEAQTSTAVAPEQPQAQASSPDQAPTPPKVNPNTQSIDTTESEPKISAPDSGYQLNSGYGAYGSALEREAKAREKASAESADTYNDYAKKLQGVEKATNAELMQLKGETDALTRDISEQKIDPHRMWNNASTGNKILAGIGILLSGMGAGISGQQNMALAVIDKAIDRDIDAQKSEFGKKRTLLEANYRRYGDIRTASQATKAHLYSVAQAQIAANAARMGGPVARARADQAMAQLEIQKTQAMQGVAAQKGLMTLQQAAIGGEAMSPALAEKMYQGRWVQMPDGSARPTYDKKGANDVRAGQAAASELSGLLDRMDRFADEKAGVTGTWSGSDNNARAESLQSQAILAVKEMGKLGVLSKSDIEDIVAPMIPNPGSFRTGRTKAMTQEMRSLMRDKLNAFYSSQIINYNPNTVKSDRNFGK
jgi:hypothetical protein